MSQQWREIGGGIEVLSNIDAVDELPDIDTIDEEGVWYIESGELAPDYVGPTNWDAAESQFTDWFSLFDGQILRAIPDEPILLPEQNDLDDFDGATSDWEIADSAVTPITTDFYLANTTDGAGQIRRNSGVTPERGQVFSGYFQESDSQPQHYILFGVQDSDNFYGFRPNSNREPEIVKDGINPIASGSDPGEPEGEWYEWEISWFDDSEGTITLKIYSLNQSNAERESEIANFSVEDAEYDAGGIGIEMDSLSDDGFHSDWRVIDTV